MRNGLSTRQVLVPLALVSAAALVLGASVGASTHRQSAASIEGTWDYGTGQVLVTPTGGDGYVGTVTKTATFSEGCPHPVGEKVWHMRGGGQHLRRDARGLRQHVRRPHHVPGELGGVGIEWCVRGQGVRHDHDRQQPARLPDARADQAAGVDGGHAHGPALSGVRLLPEERLRPKFTRSTRACGRDGQRLAVPRWDAASRRGARAERRGALFGASRQERCEPRCGQDRRPWRRLGAFRALKHRCGHVALHHCAAASAASWRSTRLPKGATILVSATLR